MSNKLPELAWDWEIMVPILIWKVAPNGFVLRKESMFTLPTDRVLRIHRTHERITLGFVSVVQAKRQSAPELGERRATVSELQGRWTKIGVCSLWQFCCAGLLGKRDEIVLTEYDRQAVPGTHRLMASGHGQGVEWRFLPRDEAERLAEREIDNEGINIVEKIYL